MALVRSGSSFNTVSPKVHVARRPGVPAAVLTGMRVRIDSRTSNSAGRCTTGSCRGKNPRVVETIKAGRVVSSGFVSQRTLKEVLNGPREPMIKGYDNDSGFNYDIIEKMTHSRTKVRAARSYSKAGINSGHQRQ